MDDEMILVEDFLTGELYRTSKSIIKQAEEQVNAILPPKEIPLNRFEDFWNYFIGEDLHKES